MDNLPFEAYIASVVRPITRTTRKEREQIIKDAHYNLFNICSTNVMIDLLTDSGTSAISNQQLGALVNGDESYAGSTSFLKLKDTVKEIFGFDHFLPVHQGRAAENVLFSTLLKEGDIVPGNTHFDTTKGHIEYRKAHAVDCTIDEAKDANNLHPFKGNVDLRKLQTVIDQSRDRIPLVIVTVTCNSGGGQPVSMACLNEVKALCAKYAIPLFLDMARFAENAYFIKTREPLYHDVSIPSIVHAMFEGTAGATFSAKKDALVSMGGLLLIRQSELWEKCSLYSILFEGFLTYGGMTGGTMGALSQGLHEIISYDYLHSRIQQVARFGQLLQAHQIPIMLPVGGHAVYIDAQRMLPHLSREELPAQALGVALFVYGGVRGVEIGTVLADRDPETRENRYPPVDLLRLAVPRRTYSDNHLRYVADTLREIKEQASQIVGLRITKEAPVLRHFTCEFEQLSL